MFSSVLFDVEAKSRESWQLGVSWQSIKIQCWRMAILPCVRGLALAALISTHLTVMLSIFYVCYDLLEAFLMKYSFRSLASFSAGLVFF